MGSVFGETKANTMQFYASNDNFMFVVIFAIHTFRLKITVEPLRIDHIPTFHINVGKYNVHTYIIPTNWP